MGSMRSAVVFVVVMAAAMYAGLCLLVAHSLHVQTLLAYSHFLKVLAHLFSLYSHTSSPSPPVDSLTLSSCGIYQFPLGSLTDLGSLNLADARNIDVQTADGLTLRGYHMLPSGEAAILASSYTLDEEDAVGRESFFDSLLPGAKRVFVYFHGTSNTRAFNHRIPIMRKLASHFDAHVVTIDYRGFGDSEGYPSEAGTALDSRATIDWLRSRLDAHSGGGGERQVPVYIYGQSLGTAVATELVVRGTDRAGSGSGSGFAGLILDAGFSELPTAALTHPVGAPFRLIPAVREYIWAHFQIQYSNLALMPAVAEGGTHMLMLHGKADWKVLPDNSRRLFQVLRHD